MPVYTLSRTQNVAMSLEECWRFFSNPHNLAKITPPALRFQVAGDLPPEIYPGMMIQYKVSPLFGIPVTWVTEIVQVNRPHSFVDEQRVGPYRLWHHEHFFVELGKGATEMRDLVHYVPPFGPFGAIINAVAIRRKLDEIFDFRRATMEKLDRREPAGS